MNSGASRGRAGVIGFIIAETSLFAVFVVAYLFYLGKSVTGPSPKEVLDLPVVSTVCLLSSSVTVALATRALAAGRVARGGSWLFVTVVLGLAFLGSTAREWRRLIVERGLTIGTNLFGPTFYPLMVLPTTLVGYSVALSGPADYLRVAHLLIGTLLAAGGTLALNQYVERDVDARMERTKRRPLPDGRLQPLEALLFASALTSLGVAYLAIGVGVAAAVLTLTTTILYICVYTPLKLRTASCMLVGAVPGALPPVAGWVAARGDLGLGAAVLLDRKSTRLKSSHTV